MLIECTVIPVHDGKSSFKLFTRVEGRQKAETVLLLEAPPLSSFSWKNIVPWLASKKLKVISVDLPGTGLSDKPASYDYHLLSQSSTLEALLLSLQIVDGVHIVASGEAALIALQFAVSWPSRVKSICFVDPVFNTAAEGKPFLIQQVLKYHAAVSSSMILSHLAWLVVREQLGSSRAASLQEMVAHLQLLGFGGGAAAVHRWMSATVDADSTMLLLRKCTERSNATLVVLWQKTQPPAEQQRLADIVRAHSIHLSDPAASDIAAQITQFVNHVAPPSDELDDVPQLQYSGEVGESTAHKQDSCGHDHSHDDHHHHHGHAHGHQHH